MKNIFNHPIGIGLSVFVVALLLGTVLNVSGFHLQGLSIVRGGDIDIKVTDTWDKVPVSVFLDQKKIPFNDNGTGRMVLENVPPGKHSVLVFNEVKWPWKKDVIVESGETTTLSPFLINKNPSGTIVTSKDEEYQSLLQTIDEATIPSVEQKLISESANVSIWVEDGVIYANWNGDEDNIPGFFCTDDGECASKLAILETADKIRNAEFFKSRDDIIIVAFSNGVFALELDKRGFTQNFQPIYKGTELPRFKKVEKENIYVLDGSAIFIINL